jgi:hypothetical protein
MAKIPKRRGGGQRRPLPKTLAQFDKLPRRSQLAIENVAHVVTRMREGVSLRSASAEYGVAPRTVVSHGGPALRKSGTRYVAKGSDNLLRVLKVPVHGGEVEVAVRGSRAATAVAERLNAQRHFANTGDDSQLRTLKRTKVLDASGREVPFLTNLDELERLGDLGVLSFESIYAQRG